MENKQLPDGLKNQMNIMENGVKQWSRLVAWSWANYLAFDFEKERSKNQQEQKLKEYFIKIFQDQARYSYTFISYGDKKKKGNAYVTSIKIKKLVLGKNSEINDDELKGITLTLPEVYEKLTNQRPEALCYEPFMQMFHAEVVTDTFSGYIRDILDSEKDEIKKVIKEINKDDLKYVNDVKYIIYFAYPPCPAFGKATVTEEQLINWMQGKNEYGDTATDYLPSSAYIPISMS
ncbi:hypothetical protein [Oscillatoria salina]|uniref:hypothetical protein n=1 Tax=Oscillatoria salina TaxID=331517 RepID=UPI0013B81C39|nr:hypothetical protein [Oscillatoria salina]MBZ8182285.1 hypothetical protein [Oscillatoria salina IIICB1]NET89170.1 hypothetical protein [Kamptonema sp. SIO1D9]